MLQPGSTIHNKYSSGTLLPATFVSNPYVCGQTFRTQGIPKCGFKLNAGLKYTHHHHHPINPFLISFQSKTIKQHSHQPRTKNQYQIYLLVSFLVYVAAATPAACINVYFPSIFTFVVLTIVSPSLSPCISCNL